MSEESVLRGWEDRHPFLALTTVSKSGEPNTVWVASVTMADERTIVIADNYLKKTKANVVENPIGSLLFITNDNTSYQLKGRFTYHESGPYFDLMYQKTPERFPRRAALVLHIEQVYSGAKQLL